MRRRKYLPVYAVLILAGFVMVLPVLMMACNSFMGPQELKEAYGAVLGEGRENLSARFLPVYPTLRPYVELLLDSPDFFVMFWNSVKQVFSTLVPVALILGVGIGFLGSRLTIRKHLKV